MSSPIWNSIIVWLEPSDAVELNEETPVIERTAASTFWVIWFSISVGAAPGWLIWTITIGNSTSGCCWMSIRLKLTTPAITSAMNSTIGTIGLRIDHGEMLRKSTESGPWGGLGLHRFASLEERARALDDPLGAVQPFQDDYPPVGDRPGLDRTPHHLVVRVDNK